MHSINLSVFVKPLCFQVWQCDLVKHHSKTFHGLLAHYGLNSHISLIVVKARSSFLKPFERLMLGELILNRSMTAYLSKISSFTLKNKNHLYKCNNGIINFCISSQVMFSSFKSTNVLHSFFHKTLPVNKGLCIWICYTQLQKYLRHCTVFWHKWPVHDLLLVMAPPLIKVASNTRPGSKRGGTTLNGREEGGHCYISQTWPAAIWSKKGRFFMGIPRHFCNRLSESFIPLRPWCTIIKQGETCCTLST